jgi:hypothetical protein
MPSPSRTRAFSGKVDTGFPQKMRPLKESRARMRSEHCCKALALAVVLGAALGGCSDIYYDRRETVALGADDHIAVNMAVQMVDPWPRYVGNKNLAFNGQRMQVAVECYRYNKVIPPVSAVTTSLAEQQAARQQSAECPARQTSTVQGAPAAAVKSANP